jgi:hypothetical protein
LFHRDTPVKGFSLIVSDRWNDLNRVIDVLNLPGHRCLEPCHISFKIRFDPEWLAALSFDGGLNSY